MSFKIRLFFNEDMNISLVKGLPTNFTATM